MSFTENIKSNLQKDVNFKTFLTNQNLRTKEEAEKAVKTGITNLRKRKRAEVDPQDVNTFEKKWKTVSC
jgi:hypothetical protein